MSIRDRILALMAASMVAAPMAAAQQDQQDRTQQDRTQQDRTQQDRTQQDRTQRDTQRQGDAARQQGQQERADGTQTRQNQSQQGEQPGQWDLESATIIGYDLDRDGQTDAWYYVSQYEYEQLKRDRDRAAGQAVQGEVRGRAMTPEEHRRWQEQQSRTYGDRYDDRMRYESERRAYDDRMRRHQNQPYYDQMRQEDRMRYEAQRRAHAERMRQDPQYRAYHEQMLRADSQRRAYDSRMGDPRMQDRARYDQNRYDQARQHRQPMQGQGMETRRVTGTVQEVTTVKFASDGAEHVIAKVKSDGGDVVPVHFGRKTDMASQLQAGKKVTIEGRMGRLNGKRIILAERVVGDGGEFTVSRAEGHELKRCDGTVVATETISLEDGKEVTLAKVRKDDGRTEIVALGPAATGSGQTVTLAEGDKIMILGRAQQVEGQPVVIVHRIYTDGDSVQLTSADQSLQQTNEFRSKYDQLQSVRQAEADPRD